MELFSRYVLQSRGGGEVVEMFDGDIEDLEFDTLEAVYTKRFGEALDTAWTTDPLAGNVTLGWVFGVPDNVEVQGDHDDFEMLVIPMFYDLDDGRRKVSLFVRLAQQRAAFEAGVADGTIDHYVHAELEQRDPDEEPRIRVSTYGADASQAAHRPELFSSPATADPGSDDS